MTCAPGTWTGSPTFSFAWTRDGSALGQTGSTYTLTGDDVGHEVRCVVVAHNANGDGAPATSNALAASAAPTPPAPPPPAPPAPASTPRAPTSTAVAAAQPQVGPQPALPPPTSGPTPAPTIGPEHNPLGLPPASGCIDRRKFSFRLRRPHGRVVDIEVFINGKRTDHVTGRNITRLAIHQLPNRGRFRVRIVATSADGTKLISQRTYRVCTKSRAKGRRAPPRT